MARCMRGESVSDWVAKMRGNLPAGSVALPDGSLQIVAAGEKETVALKRPHPPDIRVRLNPGRIFCVLVVPFDRICLEG